MEVVLLIIHLLVCMALIGLVLLQRSEGGALGMGGGGGGSLMSGRGAADALAKMTQVAGAFFLVTSISLTVVSGAGASATGDSVFDRILPRQDAPVTTPAPTPTTPDTTDPTESSAPEAADTQLASATIPAPPEVVAPAPTTGVTRAAPLQTASNPPTQQRPAVQPASTQQRAAPPPAQRSAAQTTPAAAQTPERPLVIPNTSGAVSGVTLTDDAASPPESIEIGNGVEAVRRERAGPDQ